MIELPPNIEVEKVEFAFSRHFMGMNHNYYCAVCKEHSAVQDCSTGILQPCWICQTRQGYVLVKINWLTRILDKFGFIR